jgi:bifunctional DNA-binding transcriptional regulator/antitoxin component of YhaV-PrlF toxin-antitoxin module
MMWEVFAETTAMSQTIVSSDYRVEIPEEIRREVPLESGQKVHVFAKNGVITLVPDRPLSSMRGFLRGMNIEGVREDEGYVEGD